MLLMAALTGMVLPLAAQPADYLPDQLRARVDQLKADVQHIPTSSANMRARAELTWQWVNAYALDGRYVPVNSTQVIAFVLGQRGQPEVLIRALNEVIQELTFLDEHPDAIGTLRATDTPLPAGGIATIEQTYTVGAMPIQTGGGFMVARHFMTNFGDWQPDQPQQPDYISISSSNPRVSFVATSIPKRGMHGGFRQARPVLVFKVASGTLRSGDTVTITYGDTRSGSPGLTIPTFSSDRMPLPLYLAFDNEGRYHSLPIQPIQVVGAQIAGVAGFAPSVVRVGEPFEIAIRARDRYFNRATGPLPDWQIKHNDKVIATVASQGAISTTTLSLSEPGAYHLNLVSEDGEIVGEFNPIDVRAEVDQLILWGDTHGHSGFAEGIGTAERFMRWAREDARLDYVTHSEHDIWLDDYEWEVLRRLTRDYTEQGRFIAFLGYEWTVNATHGGHHNVLFRTPDNRQRVPAQFYPTLSSLYHGLRNHAPAEDVVVIPHAHQAGDYRMSDPELEPLVEIMSQHGTFEWFGRMYLKQGHQIGFTAASDNHLSQPGYSAPLGGSLSQRGGLGAVLAPARTTDDIFDALKALRAYATTGDRIIVDFSVNGSGMGQRTAAAKQRSIRGRIVGTAPIDHISIIKNDREIWRQHYAAPADARLGRSETFLLSFASASDPFHRGDNPRGWRAWEGTLQIKGADLVSMEPVDTGYPQQLATVSDKDPNRVVFATKTRGDTSSYLLRLNNVQRTTRLQLDVLENLETGGAPPFYRPPQRVPADSFELALKSLQDGKVAHVQRFDGYTDSTTLRRVITEGPKVVEFEFTDDGEAQGDYYFMRVVQTNDAIAWSSPVWVGGHAPR